MDFFSENLGAMNDAHGKRFRRDLKLFLHNYSGYWKQNMLGDHCGSVLRDTDVSIIKKVPKLSIFYCLLFVWM